MDTLLFQRTKKGGDQRTSTFQFMQKRTQKRNRLKITFFIKGNSFCFLFISL